MRTLKRIVAFLLITCMGYGMVPGLWQTVFAAVSNPKIVVTAYDPTAKKLTLTWSQSDIQANTQSVRAIYHVPGSGSAKDVPLPVTKTSNTTSVEISESFQNDIIYDIEIDIYDKPNGAGAMIGQGFVFFIPQITFRSEIQEQEREKMSGTGGYEMGTKPILKLVWTKPMVWNTGSSTFDYADNSLASMSGQINTIYHTNPNLTSLNYFIRIPTQSSISVDLNGGGYDVSVSNNARTCSLVSAGAQNYFYLMGRKDLNAPLPDATQFSNPDSALNPLPTALETQGDHVLVDGDILPGYVYNMSIKMIFKSGANPTPVVQIGDPSAVDGSNIYTQAPLKLVPYAYTPLRFTLTRDSFNNIWVDIYRLKGVLGLQNMVYAVQYSSDYSALNWTEPTKVSDSTFAADYASAVVSGIPVSDINYYKIVVTSSDPTDRLESWYMKYQIAEDITKPSAPTGISAEAVSTTDLTYGGRPVKTSNIQIKWAQPPNFALNREKLYFYFEVNTAQDTITALPYPLLEANGDTYGGSFQLKYRLIRYVSASIHNPDISIDSNGLITYTLKGDTLFQGEDSTGTLTDFSAGLQPEANYPKFLLPNKVYYMRMYSGMVADAAHPDPENFPNLSDISLVNSFTTKNGSDLALPLPGQISATTDFTIDGSGKVAPYIVLEFGKINDPAIKYDVYMSTNAVDFIHIGRSDAAGDVRFDGLDPMSTTVKATINNFTGAAAVNNFSSRLKPNTTYYFTLRTHTGVPATPGYKESVSTAIIPVTTLPGTTGTPDETGKRPVAPINFALAKDSNGNFIVTGSKATFTWTRPEAGTQFQLIATSKPVAADDPIPNGAQDPTYQSFKNTFSPGTGVITLNPDSPPLKMTYDTLSKVALYTMDTWLYPNTIYYFSLRAVKQVNPSTTTYSAWVSIPVTTSLIDSPSSLSTLNTAELGFSWTDATPNTVPDDYTIMIKAPSDTAYKALNRSQAAIVKEGTKFYGRILGLKSNTTYKVKVVRGSDSPVTVYPETNLTTRDAFHQIEVRWKGLPGYIYELAIKTADATDYTTLAPSDFEQMDEKNLQTLGTNYSYYYAKIKSVEVTLPGGIKEHQPLSSNTKYMIKVRAKKKDPLSTDEAPVYTFSKYIGPVDTRTDFNQQDYDNVDQDLKKTASFTDRIAQLEASLFWKLDTGSTTRNEILLKAARTINTLENSSKFGFTLDLTDDNTGIDTDVVYIPASVFKALKTQNKSLVIKTLGAEFTLRPNTLDVDTLKEIKTLQSKAGVKDVFVKMTVTRYKNAKVSVANKTNVVPQVNDFKLQVLGSTKTDGEMADLFHAKVYDDQTGLVTAKKQYLKSEATSALSHATLSKLVDELVTEVESELADYVKATLQSAAGTTGLVQNVSNFSNPLMARLVYTDGNGMKQPYVFYDGASTWKNIATNTVFNANTLTFNTANTGKYAVVFIAVSANGVTSDNKFKADIEKFMSRYDLSDIFAGVDTSFNPDLSVSGKEIILLYEKVMDKTSQNKGLDIRQKAKNLKLDGMVNTGAVMKDITRQQAAGILVIIYANRTGVSAGSLKATKNIFIMDESDIDKKYYSSVLISVDLAVLSLDGNMNFKPKASMSRGEMISAFQKVLDITANAN